jgi:S1-C subfamily serine protease
MVNRKKLRLFLLCLSVLLASCSSNTKYPTQSFNDKQILANPPPEVVNDSPTDSISLDSKKISENKPIQQGPLKPKHNISESKQLTPSERKSLPPKTKTSEKAFSANKKAPSSKRVSKQELNQPLKLKTGTGFFISEKGLLLTNAHVVTDAKEIKFLMNDKNLKAELVYIDKNLDVALLKTDTKSIPIPIDVSPTQPLGTDVTVLGYPNISLQGLELKSTFGFVNANSGIQGDKRHIQFSAPIQPGSSGSPLIDEYGNAIGIATATVNQKVALNISGSLAQNVNYAVKMKLAIDSIGEHAKNYVKAQQSKTFSKKQLVEKYAQSVVLLIVGFAPDKTPQNLPDLKPEQIKQLDKSKQKPQSEQSLKSSNQKALEDIDDQYEGEIYLYIAPEE